MQCISMNIIFLCSIKACDLKWIRTNCAELLFLKTWNWYDCSGWGQLDEFFLSIFRVIKSCSVLNWQFLKEWKFKSWNLVKTFFLFIYIFSTKKKVLINFYHISSPCVRFSISVVKGLVNIVMERIHISISV